MSQLYAIVRFPDSDCVSEVPSSWLIQRGDKSQCWWPEKSKNVTSLIANRCPPDESKWALYDVEVERYCDTREKARKVAENSAYTSTDEDQLGRGLRLTAQSHPYLQSSGDEGSSHGDKNVQPPPSIPRASQLTDNSSIITESLSLLNDFNDVIPAVPNDHISEPSAQFCNLTPRSTRSRPPGSGLGSSVVEDHISEPSAQFCNLTPRSTRSRPPGSGLGSSVVEGSVSDFTITPDPIPNLSRGIRPYGRMGDAIVEDSLQKIMRILAAMKLELEGISERLTRLEENAIRKPLTEADTRYALIKPLLPIRSLDGITDFENLLTNNPAAVSQLKNFIIGIGGHQPRDNVYRVLAKLFDNNCAKLCSWKGRRNNFGVMKLKTINIVKDIICSSHERVTDLDFESYGSEWFRFAKQRQSREEKKAQNAA